MRRYLRALTALAVALFVGACSVSPSRGLFAPSLNAPSMHGAILTVGVGQQYADPSDASLEARSGDTVRIFAGTYTDCAVWTQDNLTIEGMGEGVVIGNRSCARKGVFVISGNGVTVRNLTLTGARVPSHNGAGIRCDGADLTVESVKFIDNEEGILASLRHGGSVIVRDSFFQGNGNCIGLCAHGIYVTQGDLLRVERSEFVEQHSGHHIKSRASVTQIVGNFIHDGPQGDASYLIDVPNGGTITISDNRLEKGPHAENPARAIAIGGEPKKPQHQTPPIMITNNDFVNGMSNSTVFVRNYSQSPAILESNRLHGAIVPLDGPGTVDQPAS